MFIKSLMIVIVQLIVLSASAKEKSIVCTEYVGDPSDLTFSALVRWDGEGRRPQFEDFAVEKSVTEIKVDANQKIISASHKISSSGQVFEFPDLEMQENFLLEINRNSTVDLVTVVGECDPCRTHSEIFKLKNSEGVEVVIDIDSVIYYPDHFSSKIKFTSATGTVTSSVPKDQPNNLVECDESNLLDRAEFEQAHLDGLLD